jgi:hypothetical protein
MDSHPTSKELCPKCQTPVLVAPGIGPYCPNKTCDVIDNLKGVDDPLLDSRNPNNRHSAHEPSVGPPFSFYRYRDGVRKAEGVKINRADTLEDAIQKAAKLADPGDVLVLRTTQPPSDGPTNDYRDQLYALLLRRGLHTQDESAEIAFGEGPQPKCDGQSCVHCEPENGCSRPPPPVGHPVPKVDWEVATEALREIAGYVGEDEKFDLTARDMRECARDALKVIDENERTRSGIDPPCFAEKNDGVFYVCRCPKCRATATKGGE